MRAATEFTAVFADPVQSYSEAWTESPFAAFANPKDGPREVDYWKYIHRPENEEYRENFGKGMHAMEIMNGTSGYLDFDWGRFDKPGAIFVEVIFVDAELGMRMLTLRSPDQELAIYHSV